MISFQLQIAFSSYVILLYEVTNGYASKKPLEALKMGSRKDFFFFGGGASIESVEIPFSQNSLKHF